MVANDANANGFGPAHFGAMPSGDFEIFPGQDGQGAREFRLRHPDGRTFRVSAGLRCE